MTKFILIADHLRKLNNFNTLMAIIAIFNNSAIHRLRFTREELSPKVQETLNELTHLVDSEGNYARYKEALDSATPPCIPYLYVR